MLENPTRFWSFIKSSTKTNFKPSFLRDGQTIVSDSEEKANALNRFFHSVFSPPIAHMPTVSSSLKHGNSNYHSSIQLIVAEVAETLHSLDPNKACDPDGIPCRLLTKVADEIAPSLCKLFNLSLSLGIIPTNWKLANITPVHKKDDPTLLCNFRPIFLLSVVSKALEWCIFNHCY